MNTFYNDFDLECLPGPRPREDHRSSFQIDRDRIIFSYAFRRLQSKTQVFQSGEYDFYRTRLTHSIEVARIGRSICDYLKQESELLNETFYVDPDLSEAVGSAHDLGHPPFGHSGERKLNALMTDHGGFEGNAQTLRILTQLIYERDEGPCGMSPTRALLDGILKYKQLRSECTTPDNTQPRNHFIYDDQSDYRNFALGTDDIPEDWAQKLNTLKSIECQIMDWADDTAYSLHDVLDGIQAGFLSIEKIENWAAQQTLDSFQNTLLNELFDAIRQGKVEGRFSSKIGSFIRACQLTERDNFMANKTNRYRLGLTIDASISEESKLYQKIANDLIFQSPQLQQIEFKGGVILENLFEAFTDHYLGSEARPLKILPQLVAYWVDNESTPLGKMRRICDYLADMTDLRATRTYRRLFDPEFGSITDLT